MIYKKTLIETESSNLRKMKLVLRDLGENHPINELPNIKSNEILKKLDFIEENQLISDEEAIKVFNQ